MLLYNIDNTIITLQLYNLAKLRKWKNKCTIQYFKFECSPLLHNLFLQATPDDLPSLPLKWKKAPNPLKKILEDQKVPPSPHSLGGGGEDTMDCIYTF